MSTTKKSKSTQVAKENNYEIYNRITLESFPKKELLQFLDMNESDLGKMTESRVNDLLDYLYVEVDRHCCCKHQMDILAEAFPFDMRKVGSKGRRAGKKMTDRWVEWLEINQEFWDALHDETGELDYDLEYEELCWQYAEWYDDADFMSYLDEGSFLHYGHPIKLVSN